MKKIIGMFALVATTTAMATAIDGVPVLGSTYTEAEEELVRTGAKNYCSGIEEFEIKEQCAMDYYAEHNYQGEPDCE